MRSSRTLLALCLILLVSCSHPAEETGGRSTAAGKVLLIGLEGADWEILDRLEATGTIPNLARLRREGASGVLLSEEPMLSPILWTTIATGRSPGEHGVQGFLTEQAAGPAPVRSDARRVRAFWDIASEAKRSVGVVGWPASWPAEPVEGFLVSDGPGTGAGSVWPETLRPEIDALRAEVEQGVGTTEAARYFSAASGGAGRIHVDRGPLETFVGILRTTEMYRRLAPRLMDRFHPDLMAVHFAGTDAVGHLYADAQPPPMPWLTAGQAEPASQVWDRYYGTVDEAVGELLRHVDPSNTTVLVLSDHGFNTGARRPEVPSGGPLGRQAPRWHRAEGVLVLWGRAVRSGQTLPQASLYDVLPTVLRLLDLPMAKTLRGRPLEAALLADALPAPVAPVPDYELAGARAKRTAPLDEAEVSGRLAGLRALGDTGSTTAAVSGGAPAEALRRYNQAIALLDAKKPEEALTLMRALQQEVPDAPLGWYGEGLVHLAQNTPAAAVPPLERAVRSGPKLGAAQSLLGEAYARAGRLDEALSACREAVRLEPRNPKPALLAGSLLMARQRIEEAEPFFRAALEATPAGSPEHARALVGLGVIAHGRKQPEDAHARFQEALAQSPEQPGALEGLAVLALERGEVGEALQLSERLVRVSGADPRALTLQARALLAAGRKPEAAAVLRRAVAIRPDPEAQRMLSKLEAAP